MKIFKIDRGAIGIRSSFSYYFALVLVSALLCSAQILSTEATNPRGPKQPADINPIGNNRPGQQVNPQRPEMARSNVIDVGHGPGRPFAGHGLTSSETRALPEALPPTLKHGPSVYCVARIYPSWVAT